MSTLGSPDIICRSQTYFLGARRGIQLSFVLVEPVIYLQEHDTPRGAYKNKPTILRGYLHLKITTPTRIRRISVSFRGKAKSPLLGGMSLSTLIVEPSRSGLFVQLTKTSS